MNAFRGIVIALLPALAFWAALAVIICMVLSGCTTTVLGPCPPDRCVGPYDLTLSSHREALR